MGESGGDLLERLRAATEDDVYRALELTKADFDARASDLLELFHRMLDVLTATGTS